MAFYAAAMPMYGPLEGYMDRHAFESLHLAVLAARAKAKSGHLFAQVEDEDGNVLVDERELETWTDGASHPIVPSCPKCLQWVGTCHSAPIRVRVRPFWESRIPRPHPDSGALNRSRHAL